MNDIIYLDNASTTMPYKEVVEAYADISLNVWANASNNYKISDMAKCVLENSKLKIAQIFECSPEEVFFTSGSSEANSWASIQREQLWISAFEHHNYLNNPKARIVSEDYIDTIYEAHPILDKIAYVHMVVNNESGEIFDVTEKFRKAKEMSIFTICDATQAVFNMPIRFYDYNCDMMVASSHKFGGLKGAGFCLIRKEVQKDLKPLIYGTQFNGYRGGTYSIAGAFATAKAAEISYNKMNDKIVHCGILKNIVKQKLKDSGVDYRINEGEYNINSIVNFSLANVESEIIQSMLSDENIFVGTGSGCNDGSMSASSVLTAMGVEERYLHGPIRLSFSLENSEEEVGKCMDRILEIYKELVNE